jgi:type IV secretion system protein VirB2
MMSRPNFFRRGTVPRIRNIALAVTASIATADTASAQTGGASPWENAVNVLQQSFTGPIAKGLALVAIVIGGLTFAYGEGGGKRTFAGLIFGIGMAVLAVNFLSWLFGV